jgi:cyanophycinase
LENAAMSAVTSEPKRAVITLIGGGWNRDVQRDLYRPFLACAGVNPVVACVVLDEGEGGAQYERWRQALDSTALCRPRPVLVPLGGSLDVGELADADALLVCGGLTPGYADVLDPVINDVRAWLASERPYAGFSSGAAVAAASAVVGGWQLDGRPICPPDAAEDLDELTVRPGLGLVDASVDVHASQWGTLSRAVATVRAGLVPTAFAIDEDTALVIHADASAVVVGAGAVHRLVASDGDVLVSAHVAGSTF